MKTEQQLDAIESMKDWLKHPNELGKLPAEIEIANLFEYNDMDYAILKFKVEKNSEWLFGVCGGYEKDSKYHCGHVWSEMEKYDDNAKEKCIFYIQSLMDYWKQRAEGKSQEQAQNGIEFKKQSPKPKDQVSFNEVYSYINELENNNKWQEIVKYVDINIKHFKQQREIDGIKCYQFTSLLDNWYYSLIHKQEKYKWVKNDEFKLLKKKLKALIQLQQYEIAEKLFNEMMEIAPCMAHFMFNKVSIIRKKGDIFSIEKTLDDIYPYIWNYKDFSNYLQIRSEQCIKNQDYNSAKYYLSLSLYYDNSENNFEFVNNKLKYLHETKGLNEFDRPTIEQIREYFKDNKKAFPKYDNLTASNYLYDYALKNSSKIDKNIVEIAKQNIVMINQGNKLALKVVETNVLTPNWLTVNQENNFCFEISKHFKPKLFDKTTSPNRIYSYEKGNNFINVDKSGTCDSDQDFENALTIAKANHIIDGFEILDEQSFVNKNNIKIIKRIEKSKKGNTFAYYWAKINPNLIIRFCTHVDNGEWEKDILDVINTLQCL